MVSVLNVVLIITLVVVVSSFVLAGAVFYWWLRSKSKSVTDEERGEDTHGDIVSPPQDPDPEAVRDRNMSEDEEVRLGQFIGAGSYGRVYKGAYKGKQVAIKIIECQRETLEVDISKSVSHDNLVKVYQTLIVSGDRSSPNYEPQPTQPMIKSMLIMEYCNMGTLSELLFSQNVYPIGTSTLLDIAIHIAKGMEYLHRNHIVHGDLKCENVLLCQCHDTVSGIIAKVSDFGLSKRLITGQRYAQTASLGTLSHLAPELIRSGNLSFASDVYSFGIILWELAHMRPAWIDMRQLQIPDAVLNGTRPAIYARDGLIDIPQFKPLMVTCWDDDVHARPTFTDILEIMNNMHVDTGTLNKRIVVEDL